MSLIIFDNSCQDDVIETRVRKPESAGMMETFSLMDTARELTETLWWQLEFSKDPVNADFVSEMVQKGANIYYQGVRRPILHTLVARGCTEAVKALMRNDMGEMDFSVRDSTERTVLHVVLLECPEENALQILVAISERVANYPQLSYHADWERDGISLVDAAASSGRLWMLCRTLMRVVPYFNDKPNDHFMLKVPLGISDNKMLSAEERQWFMTLEQQQEMRKQQEEHCELMKMQKAKEATEKLIQLCEMNKWDEMSAQWNPAFSQCIQDGADVMVQYKSSVSLLTELLLLRCYKSVEYAIRSTPSPITFRRENRYGATFLHYLSISCTESYSVRSEFTTIKNFYISSLLAAIANHGAKHNTLIPWDAECSPRNPDGMEPTCISCAAKSGMLSRWWEAVKKHNVTFYIDRSKKIVISAKVSREDWMRIPEMDKRPNRFIVTLEEPQRH